MVKPLLDSQGLIWTQLPALLAVGQQQPEYMHLLSLNLPFRCQAWLPSVRKPPACLQNRTQRQGGLPRANQQLVCVQNPFQTNVKYYQYLNLVSSFLQPHKREQMVLASGGEKEGGTKWEVSKAPDFKFSNYLH